MDYIHEGERRFEYVNSRLPSLHQSYVSTLFIYFFLPLGFPPPRPDLQFSTKKQRNKKLNNFYKHYIFKQCNYLDYYARNSLYRKYERYLKICLQEDARKQSPAKNPAARGQRFEINLLLSERLSNKRFLSSKKLLIYFFC